MGSARLSHRTEDTLVSIDRPWRFAPRETYHPERNPKGLISFGLAENKLITQDLVDYANATFRFTDKDFQYGSAYAGGLHLRKSLAVHLNEFLEPRKPITHEEIQVMASATAIHDTLAWAMADPGEVFLATRPLYGRFEIDFFNKSSVGIRYADSTVDGTFDKDVVHSLQQALQDCHSNGIKARALIIVNPHNPLGRCYPRETLIALLQFCQRHQIHLISDEIYACSVFDSGQQDVQPFTSILSIDVDKYIDADLLHVTYGLSKDFGAAGLRIGALITKNRRLQEAFSSVARFHNISGPALSLGTNMLSNREWCRSFMQNNRDRLSVAFKHVTAELDRFGIEYLPGSNAGFFIWINLSPFLSSTAKAPEFALATELLDAGVFLHPQEEHSPEPGWFRLVYTQQPEVISEGLKRMVSVLSNKPEEHARQIGSSDP